VAPTNRLLHSQKCSRFHISKICFFIVIFVRFFKNIHAQPLFSVNVLGPFWFFLQQPHALLLLTVTEERNVLMKPKGH